MANKFFSKALSVGLSLSLCAGLVAPALAATVADLNAAINGDEGATLDNGHTGYGYNESTNNYGIEAWTEGDTRNVQLKEEVTNEANDKVTIDENVKLDLNDQKLDLGTERITVDEGSKLTVDDSGENGTIQTENNYAISNNGTLDVQDGTINSDKYAAINNAGQATIGKEADLTGKVAGAVSTGGSMTSEGTITGGTYGILATKKGEESVSVEVTGGNVDGSVAGIRVQQGAEATVSGDASITSDRTGVIISGTDSKLNIEGGTIHGNINAISASGKPINSIEEAEANDQITISGDASTIDINNDKVIYDLDKNGAPELDGYLMLPTLYNFYYYDKDGNFPYDNVEKRVELAENLEITYSYEVDGVVYVGTCLQRSGLKDEAQYLTLPTPYYKEGADRGTPGVDIKFTIRIADADLGGCNCVVIDRTPGSNNDWGWFYPSDDSGTITVDLTPKIYSDALDKGNPCIFYLYFAEYSVTVEYVDENGNEVAPSETKIVIPGTDYSFDSPAMEGYETPEAVSGTMPWANKNITVVYKSASTPDNPENPETPDDPDIPDDTEIEDPEIPLAGLFTRGDAIGYLWEQSGSPEADLSTFEDVPEDHVWAVAIGWAQDMGIARADEEGNFRPDDLVLRGVEDLEIDPEGELQEFLNWYAEYAGVKLDAGEFFIELEGALDDVIMGEDAQIIFDDFFARLEAALSQAA